MRGRNGVLILIYLRMTFFLLLSMGLENFAEGQSKSFHTGLQKPKKERKLAKKKRLGIDVGMHFPDMTPIGVFYRFSTSYALRGFISPQWPFNIKVEFPEDTISSQNGITLSHPDLNAHFDATYGPQWGLEGYYFPFQGSFYLALGASYRRLLLDGRVSSSLNLEVPGQESVSTNSIFSIKAKADTSQYVLRSAVGFHWPLIFWNSYAELILLGVSLPFSAHSHVSVSGDIINPKAPDQVLSEALATFKAEKEVEMEQKAKEAMRPVEELILPMIGVRFGVYF